MSDRPYAELCGGSYCVPFGAVLCDASFITLEKPFLISDELRQWAQDAAGLVEEASKLSEGEWLFPDLDSDT